MGTTLFDIIEPFADYAFNKSHSYGYGLVAYQTAWLKAHHPTEYMAALLTSVKDNKDKTAVYLAECRNRGIAVLPPDVNRSVAEFAPDLSGESEGAAVLFGMAAVRNVGESLVERIVAERNANGPFVDIFDFCQRVDPVVLNKRTMESLVKGGAFDALGHPRQGLCLVMEGIVDRTLERRREHDLGITSLFAAFETEQETDPGWGTAKIAIPDTEFDKAQRLAFEKEMLGLYVSDHPLMGYEQALARHTDCSLSDMREEDVSGDRSPVRAVGGVVTDLRRTYTKKGDLMARFVLEDLQAAMEVFVFPKTMADYGALIENDAILVVRGRLDTREEEPKIVCMEVSRPRLERGGEDVHIALPLGVLTDTTLVGLKGILSGHPGPSSVLLHVGAKVLRLAPEFNVDCRNGLVGELKRLLGPGAVLS